MLVYDLSEPLIQLEYLAPISRAAIEADPASNLDPLLSAYSAFLHPPVANNLRAKSGLDHFLEAIFRVR